MKRNCPDCGRTLSVGSVKFDKDHNATCSFCGEIIMPARQNKERIQAKKTTTTTSGSYKNPRRQADIMNGVDSYNAYD